MKTPGWLVALALVLWGWFASLPLVGLALAAGFLAAPPLLRRELSARAFARTADGCALLAVLVLAYFVVTAGVPGALHEWLRSAPLWLFPLPFAQALHGGDVPLPTLLVSQRSQPITAATRRVDTLAAYALACLLGSTSVVAPNPWLYPATAALVAVWLWRLPSARGDLPRRGMMLVLAVGLGYAVQAGLYRLQGEMEEFGADLLSSWNQGESDPFHSRTHIGDLGRLKLGDRIVIRVRTAGAGESLLLREAVYDTYLGGQWYARQGAFSPLAAESGEFSLSPVPGQRQVRLSLALAGGHGLLPLPAGATALTGVAAKQVSVHPMGAVRVEEGSGWQSFDAGVADLTDRSSPPGPRDLQVPDVLQGVLAGVATQLHLSGQSPAQRVAALERHFADNFRYSLYLGKADGRTLSDFLLRDRRGHCEYFATATVLLLRQAGVPARYVVGYSAQEYSPREHGLVVRQRHAHAWATAYVDGRWREIDTTPAQWAEDEERAAAAWYDPLLDIASWAYFELRQSSLPGGALLAGAALLAVMPWLWRRIAKAHWLRRNRPPSAAPDPVALAWLRVESCLSSHPRLPHETPQAWLSRIDVPESPLLRQLVAEYYRLRFDPAAGPELRREFLTRCDEFVRSGPRR